MVVHDLASLKCQSPPPCPQVPPMSPKILNPKWLYMFPNPKCGRKWRLSVGASEAGPLGTYGNLFMVIWGMVYCCFSHIVALNKCIFHHISKLVPISILTCFDQQTWWQMIIGINLVLSRFDLDIFSQHRENCCFQPQKWWYHGDTLGTWVKI